MTNPRTVGQLAEGLDQEFSWRLQELSSLRQLIRQADGVSRRTALRAAVPVLYAHWEGFVKEAAVTYGRYISNSRLRYRDVRLCFLGIRALGRVRELSDIKRRIFAPEALLADIFAAEESRVVISLSDHLDDIGNLDFDRFEQIALFLSIDIEPYVSKRPIIDEVLLSNRNKIAHGEYLPIDERSYEELSSAILELMRQFKTDVQNGAALKKYLRQSPLVEIKGQ